MKKEWKRLIQTVLGVLAGNAVLAFAVAAFVVPHGIIMGGATGIGLILSRFLPFPLSVVILAVNAFLFVLGALVLGKKFALTTILSTFIYPAFLSVAQSVPGITELTENMMLATIYGGVLLGAGIGLVIKVGASTGGTDILALVLNKWFHIPVAILLYVVDFIVLGSQIFFSTPEQVMYGIMALVLTTVILNRVMLLGKSQIQLFIISEKYEEIKERVLKEMDAGVTMVHIETGFGARQQKGVLCIIPNRKLYSARELVHSIDAKAFITITQINEVSGRGFTLEKVPYTDKEDSYDPDSVKGSQRV